MNDAERFKLLHAPYRPPRCRVGGKLFCLVRGWVTVLQISAGPIPWPVAKGPGRGGRPSLVLCGDLVKAVTRESEIAVGHHWGVGLWSVWKWRRALGVPATNAGTSRLRRDYFAEPWAQEARAKAHAQSRDPCRDGPRREKIRASKQGKPRPPSVGRRVSEALRGRPLTEEHRRKLSEAQRRRGARPPKAGRPWAPQEEALLGQLPDAEVARRTGRTLGAVRSWRQRLRIPSVSGKGPRMRPRGPEA